MLYLQDIEKFVSNKMIFCGIDIHKERWMLCYICENETVEKVSIKGDIKLLMQHTQRKYSTAKNVHFVYEAGFSGFYVYRHLTASGYLCTITPPNRIPSMHDKVKTDKRDAEKLAQFLIGGLLKKVFVPPLEVEADRQLLRQRNSYQKKLTRLKNQIKSHLYLQGIYWSRENGNKWTKAHIAWLETLNMDSPNLRCVLEQYLAEYYFLRSQIANMTQKIRELSRSESYSKHFKLLLSCKGIGLITAMTFLLELHEILRFSSAEKFCSFIGITPSQYSSGEHVRLGHITREGNPHLRRVLVESAWTVIRYDPFLRAKYDRIYAKGTNCKKAIVAVAHSLAIRLRRCLLDENPYVIKVC